MKYFKWLAYFAVHVFICLVACFAVMSVAMAQNATFEDTVSSEAGPDIFSETETTNVAGTVYMFGRDDCGFCKKQKEFFAAENIPFVYLNIVTDEAAKELYTQVVEKHDLTKVTPITVIGERVFLGFNGPLTTGIDMKAAIESAGSSDVITIEDHLARAPQQEVSFGGGCSDMGCTEGEASYVFDLPFVGVVDLKTFSLFGLSLLLGTIDGFNPCAMWVLITFLAILAQAGSRRKMIFLAGVFIAAEAIMYNLILNVWYKTWDFVALDQIVTPLVGFLALGGGSFFLYRWYKNRNTALVCDITSIDSQTRTINKFKFIASQKVTLTTVFAILVIAFSVNVIEFACSIGIPQAYTKILELNMLTFVERQWYILVYTAGYIIDDLLVFGLAIWGYGKIQAHGQKYAQYSLLIGGVLMLLLGVLLIVNPSLLVL
ncbi:glutaredoxin family protein [Patescibacteria group bacterium]|nr:glutaredoxin family protein [Patescibacteria group bacterium]